MCRSYVDETLHLGHIKAALPDVKQMQSHLPVLTLSKETSVPGGERWPGLAGRCPVSSSGKTRSPLNGSFSASSSSELSTDSSTPAIGIFLLGLFLRPCSWQ